MEFDLEHISVPPKTRHSDSAKALLRYVYFATTS